MIKDTDYSKGLVDLSNREEIIRQIDSVKETLTEAHFAVQMHPSLDVLKHLKRARRDLTLLFAEVDVLIDCEVKP